MKKRMMSLALAGAMMMALSACGGGSGNANEVFELSMAGLDSEETPSTQMMNWIAEEVESRTEGNVKIKVYPNNRLGEAKLQYQGVMDGSIDMFFGYLDPTYDVVFDTGSIPYLTSNDDEIKYLLQPESNIYQLFDEHTSALGMNFKGFFLNGVIGMFSTKNFGDYLDPSVSKDNLIRIPSSATYRMGIEALGYPTVSIPWSDTYTSMQTGVMDGMTGIPSYMVDTNFGDLTKYYLPNDIWLEMNVILMSAVTEEKLPAEYVTIINEVCAEASTTSLGDMHENVDAGIAALEARGVEICAISDEERNELAEYMRAELAPELEELFGADIMAKINEDLANANA